MIDIYLFQKKKFNYKNIFYKIFKQKIKIKKKLINNYI